MSNSCGNLVDLAVLSHTREFSLFEIASMSASVRDSLAAGIRQIIDGLKASGISQSAIAAKMGWDNTVLSQIKAGRYNPSLKQLDKLLDVLNQVAPKGQTYGPQDLFRDPIETLRAEALAKGYDLVKK